MSELMDAITGLSPAQLELLKQHLEKLKPATGSPTTTRIRPRDRSESDPIPLSLAQQGYWFQEQLDPTRTRSNLTAAVRINGLFDAAALARAVDEIVRRHETLHTTFKLVEGEPAQFVSPTQTTKLQLLDLSHLPEAEREAEALQLAAAEPLRRFELTEESLLRATLVRLSEDANVLLLTIHHIVCDRWSQGLLIGELLTLYQAFAAGQPSSLPDLPVQYPDFALWQHDWLQSEEMKKQLSYWKKQLDGAPAVLDIPTDRPRTSGVRGQSRKFRFTFSRELMEKIKKLSRDEDTTLFVVLLATLNTLLYRYTAQPDIVVGSVIANRNRPEIVNLIGLFANTVLLRTKLARDLSFRGLLKQVAEMSLDSQTNQDLPFEKLAQELQTEGTGVPRFQVVFNLQKSPAPFRPLPGLTLSQIDVSQELASFDLFWLLEETDDGLSGLLEYNSALFDDSTIDQFSEAFIQILQTAVQQPDTSLSAFALPHDLEAKRLAARMREQRQTIAVSATFTAEPLEQVLNFWMQELDTPSQVTFAPHNQVFQQLLVPDSLLSTNERGINVLLVRLEDWQGFEEDGDWTGAKENIERNVNDFAGALAGATQRSNVPYLVCLCSASPSILNDPERESFFRRMQDLLVSKLAEIKQVYVVSPNHVDTLYPVSDYFDAVRNKLGHVSYTPVFFTALGTIIARKIHAIQSRPYKCVVTDCDQTLWKGVCAEDGIAGIEVDATRRELQEFLIARHEAGMLICVCSKNNERDVVEVFERGRGMVLRRDQVISWRINWESKSDNIRSLARELNLGLDSFIFIDDNPVECAEVAANCPGVLSLQLPSDAAAIPKFLKHVWAFDQLQTTEEDRQRTTLYKQNREREQFRHESLSLETFFEGLGLQIQVSETEANEIERVSQLTWRTNQFNTSSIRRSENEVRELLRSDDWGCLSIRVKDRFGDYGLVGAIMFKEASESLYVDTFLLSCRALGKGVEHRMLAEVGRIALARELSRVEIPCRHTERNQPVRDFLESVAGEFSDVYRLPATVAAACSFQPSQVAEPHESRTEENVRPAVRAESALISRIANELSDPEEVTRLIASRNLRARDEVEVVYTAPSTPVEEMLADIWTSILNLDRVGIKDNFFKIGGHSLLGTLLISRIRDNFQVELPLLVLFERPTIAGLAEVIEQELIKQVDSSLMAEMMEGLDQLTDEEVKALLTDETSQLARARSAD
ncbi:MAG TPA: HAD-IIIC family phosphatase [Pyrinomonadaceae bacterium]|nr:HAD-IIIC family phosphatase [Pyrinomonadaceae bacterium]